MRSDPETNTPSHPELPLNSLTSSRILFNLSITLVLAYVELIIVFSITKKKIQNNVVRGTRKTKQKHNRSQRVDVGMCIFQFVLHHIYYYMGYAVSLNEIVWMLV